MFLSHLLRIQSELDTQGQEGHIHGISFVTPFFSFFEKRAFVAENGRPGQVFEQSRRLLSRRLAVFSLHGSFSLIAFP
jgi:hypothetical protein